MSSGTSYRVALARTDGSKEHIACIFRVGDPLAREVAAQDAPFAVHREVYLRYELG
jgi:hypothetical protein